MHVLFCSEDLSGNAGYPAFVVNLARGLVKSGHRVTVLEPSKNGIKTKYQIDGINVLTYAPRATLRSAYYSALIRIPVLNKSVTPFLISRIKNSSTIDRVIRSFSKREKIDLVEFAEGTLEGYYYTQEPEVPVVVRLHGSPTIMASRLASGELGRYKWYFNLEREVLLKAAALAAPSDFYRLLCLKHYRLEGVRDITAIPNPLDTDEYSPDPSVVKKPKSVVFAKRIDKISGGEHLKAIIGGVLARVPDAFFHIIGRMTDELDGGARLLEDIIKGGFGGNVKFHGQINRRDVIGFYRSSRLCIVPSLLESFSYTCMEALSCGIPVVGSRVGAIPDMVRDGENGFLVEPGDVGGFVDKTVAILQNPALQDKMAVSARERILSDFNYDSIIKKNIAFYESVIYSSGKTTG